jgi:hypothetical protein
MNFVNNNNNNNKSNNGINSLKRNTIYSQSPSLKEDNKVKTKNIFRRDNHNHNFSTQLNNDNDNKNNKSKSFIYERSSSIDNLFF